MNPAATPPRSVLTALQAAAEDSGRALQASAFQRLVLLSELAECLDDGPDGGKAQVSAFCAEAVTQLADLDPGPTADAVASRLLDESSARWGHYLGLIEVDTADSFDPAPPAESEDEPAALDASTLVRLLTGAASSPKTATSIPAQDYPAPPDESDDEPAALDAGTLVRLLTGAASSPQIMPPHGGFEVPPPPTVLAIDPELRDIFLAEGTDLFERVETLVLDLGREPENAETHHELGRCFHTLKGAAGSVGLLQVAALIHSVEEEMEASAGGQLVDTLHEVLHYLDGVFAALRRGGGATAPPEEHPPTAAPPRPTVSATPPPRREAEPERRSPGVADRRARTAETQAGSSEPAATDAVAATNRAPTSTAAEAPVGEGPLRVPAEKVDELMDHVSELIARRGLWVAQTEAMKEFAVAARMCRHRLSATIDRLRESNVFLESSRTGSSNRRASDREDLVGLLLKLTEQAEDLTVLAESTEVASAPLADNNDALARTSRQLWESLQAVRIVPVRGLFQRLARVAHDAARVEGRQVAVALVGEDTGVDRAVQDKAFEPLLHVVRNAVSHGIEPADERLAAGKPSTGRVTLEASRIGNTLVLSVCDDGRGLNYAAIEAKGRRLGLIAASDRPGIDQLNALIFQPGFSTRDAANSIAGRGVGMDVVSQEVGRLHGTVELESRTGEGTRLSLRLPALSLQQAMVLRLDGRALALPVEIVELAQPFDPAGLNSEGPEPRVFVKDQWIPLVSARAALGLPPAPPGLCPKLLMIRADGGLLAIQVDSIDGTSELVFKPLGPLLSGHPTVSGTSLSVTGEVVLALNPSGMARRVGGVVRREASVATTVPSCTATVLVVDDSISVRKVVARQIRGMGLVVEEVSDGLEALGRLRTRTYGLVISDLEMPRMDGFELLAELGRLAITPRVPVVVASTRFDPETRRKVMALGAREFLNKPIDPEALTALVREQYPLRTDASVDAACMPVGADRGNA